MRSLLIPTDEKTRKGWAIRLMARALLGLLAWHSLIWIMAPVDALWMVMAGYFYVWEVGVQRLGAALLDTLVDTAGVTWGALLGLELLLVPVTTDVWSAWPFLGVMLGGVAILFAGAMRRPK